jgi:hypothetical protein
MYRIFKTIENWFYISRIAYINMIDFDVQRQVIDIYDENKFINNTSCR